MKIHFSILVLILAIGLMSDRKLVYYKQRNKNYIMPLWPWLIIFGYITFLAAMRSGMNDTSAYIHSFENCEGTFQAAVEAFTSADIKYKFTAILENLFKAYVSKDYHMWFLFFASIQSICFVHVYRRESYGFLIPCFFFFTSALYYNYFSMLRQWTAVAIMFYGFEWLKERDWKKYLICCLVAGLFHPSAYICIIFSVLSLGKPWSERQNYIIMLFAVAIFFLEPLLNMLEKFTEGGVYDYALSTMLTNSGSSPVRIVIAVVPVLFTYLCRRLIAGENDEGINICVNMSIFYCLLTIVASMTSGLYVIRLATYLSPYNAILYSYLLRNCFEERSRKIVTVGFYGFYFMYYYYQMSHQGAWGYISNIIGNFS